VLTRHHVELAFSVPALVERINNALQRADQIEHAEGNVKVRPTPL
jgi:isocitrate lyase